MSGENIKNLLAPEPAVFRGPYSGKYEKRMVDLPKPTYSTFYDKKGEYDGTHPRYFKQRDAIIGPVVNDKVDPQNFLRSGKGFKHIVPPIRHRKHHIKGSLDCGNVRKGQHDVMCPGTQEHDKGTRMGDSDDIKVPLNPDLMGVTPDETVIKCDFNVERPREQDYPLSSEGAVGFVGEADKDSGDSQGVGKSIGERSMAGNGESHTILTGCPPAKKDFVASNIIEANNMVPKRRKDQPENPAFRKSFGRVPGYMRRVKGIIEQERMQFEAISEARAHQHMERMAKYVYRLDEQERLSMLSMLKTKLTEKGAELNRMPFAKDTYIQMRRKAGLEKHIKEIETSIEKLEKDAVFIYNDDPRVLHWTKDAAFEEARRFACD